MPELPEVETTRRGIAPHVEGRRIARVVVRDARLRQPVTRGIDKLAAGAAAEHALLRNLGPEPLGRAFHGGYLHRAAAGRTVPIKSFIMNSKVVVGVGNIYANEALFAAAVDPWRAAGELSGDECRALAVAIKRVLRRAIAQGG